MQPWFLETLFVELFDLRSLALVGCFDGFDPIGFSIKLATIWEI